jgi:uncharacterized protein (DUF58 family)
MDSSLNLSSFKNFDNIELLAKKLVEGFITGLHRSPYHGFSVEFSEYKHYNFGESTKNIDWKIFAKTDQLFVKQYEEETNLRCTILMDLSPSMYYPKPKIDKIRFSVYCAAALTHLMISQRDAVGLMGFSEDIKLTTFQKSSRSHLHRLLVQLDNLIKTEHTQSSTSQIAESIHAAAEKISRRSLVIIFTDMFQSPLSSTDIYQALQHLKHKKHEILLFHVSDQNTEKVFNFENHPYLFVDSENGRKIKIVPSHIKEQYRKKTEKFYSYIQHMCGQLKIDLVAVDTKDDFDKILYSYLVKRRKMR